MGNITITTFVNSLLSSPRSNIAECIKNARIKAGLTQKDVAERIGKKREYVALIERGETDMQLSTFIMMSEAVGLHFVLSY